jgi:hypothetical protein
MSYSAQSPPPLFAAAPGANNFPGMPAYLPPSPPEPPKRRRGLLVGITVAVVAAVAASAGTAVLLLSRGPVQAVTTKAVSALATAAGPATLTVSGTFVLTDDNLFLGTDGCAGQDGYSDISTGAAVTVTDGTGAIVGLGRLDSAQLTSTDDCTFSFSVADVPAGKNFYGVEVTHRGAVKYAEADLAEPLALTLGS